MNLQPSSHEQCVRWYRLACAAIFAMPLLACLSLPGLSPELTRSEQLQYVLVESLLAACLGLLAVRLREASQAQTDSGSQLLPAIRANLAEMRNRGVRLGELGQALRRNEHDGLPPSRPQTTISSSDLSMSVTGRPYRVIGFDNSALAKRLEADTSKLRVAASAARTVERSAVIREEKVGDANRQSPAPPSVEDVQCLFRALRKGTTNHLDREPSTRELATLVEACFEVAHSDAIWLAARQGTLSIHWDGEHWAIDLPAVTEAT